MGILSVVKGDSIPALEKQLRNVQSACDRTRASRASAVAALAEVSEKLAEATLYGEDVSLQSDFVRTERQVAAFDLALARGDADADALRLRIAAETNKAERQAVAAQLEAQADSIEKTLAPLRKLMTQLFDGYNNNSRAAAETTSGSNPVVLAYGVDFAAEFIAGDALDLLVETNRRLAKELREGRHDPAAFRTTFGGQYEAFTGRKKVVGSR